MTVAMVLAVWLALSVPVAVVVGLVLRDEAVLELVGMDGLDAVFVDAGGHQRREPLVTPSR
ncbi:MAG TPA: hypothetical protein VGJ03_05860 [Acidimicrobiales bacterium]|jgi:hypothetical protein